MASLENVSRGLTPVASMRYARSFGQRLVGLLNRSSIAPDEGLFFEEAASLHMLGMRFAIAAIWLSTPDGDGLRTVLRAQVLKAWTGLAWPPKGAKAVLEGHPDLVTMYAAGEQVREL